METLHRGCRHAHIQLLVHELIGHTVEMPLHGDVVVDIHPRRRRSAYSKARAGKGFRAGLSNCSKSVRRQPGNFRNGRLLYSASNGVIAELS